MPESDDAERGRARFQVVQDPYLDPDWAILKNKVHARTQGELDAAEVALVHVRTLELVAKPVQGPLDLAHLQTIHRHLFQDVYPFAGELRTLDIRKADDPSGGFMPVSRLRDAANYVFSELAKENQLRGLDTEAFVGRLSHYLDEVPPPPVPRRQWPDTTDLLLPVGRRGRPTDRLDPTDARAQQQRIKGRRGRSGRHAAAHRERLH